MAFFFVMASCSFISYFSYLREVNTRIHDSVKKVVNDIESVLLHSSSVARHTLPLAGLPCGNILSNIRKEAILSSYVSTINIVNNNVLYCSSFHGDVSIKKNHNSFFVGKLALKSGAMIYKDVPTLFLMEKLRNRAAIVSVETKYIIQSLSQNSNNNQLWLQVGEQWLDKHGVLLSVKPAIIQSETVKGSSKKFPFSVYIEPNESDASFVGWYNNRLFHILFFIIFSCCISIAVNSLILRRSSKVYALRRSIKMQEFVPFVQPIVDSQTRKLRGIEVLMRWEHPTLGLTHPDMFIHDAEKSGLIVPITSQILSLVAEKLSPLQSILPAPFHIAINTSAAHFTSMALVEDCANFLKKFQQGRVVLTLELTERELLTNDSYTLFIYDSLRSMGVQFSLDDFGTGHASLAYLKQFHIDEIKIDMSFVQRLGVDSISHKIVDNVIDLGMSLGLTLVAEGVETDYQANYLREKCVDYLQGYLFSKPHSLDDFAEIFLKK